MSLSVGTEEEGSVCKMRSASAGSDNVSVKSDQSMGYHPNLSDETLTSDFSIKRRKRPRLKSPEPSSVSVKSSRSMDQPHTFSDGPMTSDPQLVY